MNLSVVYPNAYPGRTYIEFGMRNLAAQTCRDFETVIVDMAYEQNKGIVTELSDKLGFQNLLHVPACEARHVGRLVHWELYNNGALFASNPWLMFYGAKRYVHRSLAAAIIQHATEGTAVNIAQVRPPDTVTIEDVGFDEQLSLPMFGDTVSQRFDAIEEAYNLHVDVHDAFYLAQTGFFSIPKDTYINILNGYNEALVVQHWVDNEMNIRMAKIRMTVGNMHRGLLRLNSKAGYGAVPIGKPICQHPDNTRCIRHTMNLRKGENHRVEGALRFEHDGFGWIYCDTCGAVAVDMEFDYMNHQVASSNTKAPINVRGVGRNLARIADDLKPLSLSEKINLMQRSHTEPRYLEK